jgi:hypothetical protein
MDTTSVKIQLVWFAFAAVLFCFATVNPKALIQLLGRGRVVPSQLTLLIFRVLGAFCVLGATYRFVTLLRQF